MLQISVAPRPGYYTAFDRFCPEYAENGNTQSEAIGNLIVRLVKDNIIDTIEIEYAEIEYIDKEDMRSEVEIERRLNGEI